VGRGRGPENLRVGIGMEKKKKLIVSVNEE